MWIKAHKTRIVVYLPMKASAKYYYLEGWAQGQVKRGKGA